MAGNTLSKITEDGKPLIPQSLYIEWIKKLNTDGFDYPIDCTQVVLPKYENLFS